MNAENTVMQFSGPDDDWDSKQRWIDSAELCLDPEERECREKGECYLINCVMQSRMEGYPKILTGNDIDGVFLGLKGYLICPIEKRFEVNKAVPKPSWRQIGKLILAKIGL